MTDLLEVIDRQGPPPNDLCVDWAWQLYEFSLARDHNDEQRETQELGAQTAPAIEIGEQGRLENQSCSSLELRRLASQLLRRMEPASSEIPSAEQLREQLENATFLLEGEPASRTGGNSTYRRGAKHRSGKRDSKVRRENLAGSSKQDSVARRPATKALRRPLVFLTCAASLLVLCVAGFVWWPAPSASSSATDSNREVANSGPADIESQMTTGEIELLDPDIVLASENNDPDSAEATDFVDSQDTVELLQLDPGLNGLFPTDEGSATLAEPNATQPEIMPQSTNKEVETDGMTNEPGMEAEKIDVMAELAEVAKQAETDVRETELPAEPGDSGVPDSSKPLDPFVLPTVPMLQVQKLAPQYRQRARDPAWRLRIETSEGFKVMPPGPQTLSERETVSWLIQLDEPSSAGTQIYVQAQLSGSRGRSIRWRIGVGSKEMPQLVLPLAQQYLDRLQVNLANAQARLQFAIDRLKAVGGMAGMPTDLRSAMSAQRKGFESQLELATQVLEIASEANQFEGWLDGQLEIHAELVDSAAQGSPPLLQFGTLAVPKVVTDDGAEPKVQADDAALADPDPDQ